VIAQEIEDEEHEQVLERVAALICTKPGRRARLIYRTGPAPAGAGGGCACGPGRRASHRR
jgi:hypothetical protein